jgi:hypothetical protein
MRITKVEKMRGEYVDIESDGEFIEYRRLSEDNWERLWGMSWEAEMDCAKLEKLYRGFTPRNNKVPIPRCVNHKEVDFYMSNLCGDFNGLMTSAQLSECLAEAAKDGKVLFSEDMTWLLCQLYHALKDKSCRNG